jgi:hypothetical protein
MKPLPTHLRMMMMMQSRPLLFLGCGLAGDVTPGDGRAWRTGRTFPHT